MTKIGLVFDFDDTLAPDSTTKLLEEHGIDPTEFWEQDFKPRVTDGYDPTIAYLTQIIDLVGPNNPLGNLTKEDLQTFGSTLDSTLYEGVPEVFDALDEIVAEYDDIEIEYYVISEGLETVIEATELADRLTGIYGSKVDTDENGVLSRIKRPISFTDKTRYLFEINKGITSQESRRNPYEVNKEFARKERSIFFENIIYIGDGITDIPCFSVVKDRGGRVFGVIDKENISQKQKVIQEIGGPRRTRGSLNTPNYTANGVLGSLLRLTVEGICTEREIDQREAI